MKEDPVQTHYMQKLHDLGATLKKAGAKIRPWLGFSKYLINYMGGLATAGVLTGSGKTLGGKLYDGILAVTDVHKYLPTIHDDVRRLKTTKQGIEEIAQSGDDLDRFGIHIDQAKEALTMAKDDAVLGVKMYGDSVKRVYDGGIDLAHKVAQGAAEKTTGLKNAFTNLLGGDTTPEPSVPEMLARPEESFTKSALNTATESFQMWKDSVAQEVTALKTGYSSTERVKEATNALGDSIEDIQTGSKTLGSLLAEIDISGMWDRMTNFTSNMLTMPVLTLGTAGAIAATTYVAANGIYFWGRRGVGNIFKDSVRRWGRKRWADEFEAAKSNNPRPDADLELDPLLSLEDYVRGAGASIATGIAGTTATVAIAGIAVGDGDGFFGKIGDVTDGFSHLANMTGLSQDAVGLHQSVGKLASLKDTYNSMIENASSLKLLTAYDDLKTGIKASKDGLTGLVEFQANEIYEMGVNLVTNIDEQLPATLAAAALVASATYAANLYANFWANRGQGGLVDIILRNRAKKIWPEFWKAKLKTENPTDDT